MLDFLTFVYVYLAFTAFLILVLLFGDAPWAQGTPLSFSRWLISEAWVDALGWLVAKTLGLAGIRALDTATELCCERSNPTLQIGYLIIWSVGYGLYWEHVFKLLPNLYAAEWHMYTGTGMLCLTLTTFLLASGTGPGRVTKDNAARYLAAYPPDGLLFPPKVCETCQLPRPGRSKHCGVCGGCIPRFDHHCGWVNACVGLHNTRVFLLFLAANLATCVYGLWLMALTMRGELHKRGAYDLYVYDPMTRSRAPLHTKPGTFIEFLLVRYPVQVALGLFIAVGGLLLAAFLLYQVYLISAGCTTYEQFKRNTAHREMRDLAAAQALVAAAAAAAGAGVDQEPQRSQPAGMAASDQQAAEAAAAVRQGTAGTQPQQQQLGAGLSARQVQQQQQQEEVARQYWRMQEEPFLGGSWWPWRQSVRGYSRVAAAAAAAAAAAVPKPAAPYDRGWKANWAEVLFPERFLQQQQQLAAQQHQRRGVGVSRQQQQQEEVSGRSWQGAGGGGEAAAAERKQQ